MKKAEIEIIFLNSDVVVTSGCDPELVELGYQEG